MTTLQRTSRLMFFILWLFGISILGFAQAPTGTISGTVTDESGAVVPSATVTISNKATNFSRTITTNTEGLYSAPALPAGDYEVRVELQGFRTLRRDAQVAAGSTTTVEMKMSLGTTQEVVTVEAATAEVNYESHTIQGVIARQSIQELPLNGRNFLALASLEPGVTLGAAPPAQFNSQFYVAVNGALGNVGTRLTVDGGNINDQMEGGSSMNFSQEVVEEFQISQFNFDPATGITGTGAINIVTRSGTNDYHGSGYFFFRDHNMAAYPGLARSVLNPNPFFARRNPGFWVGGPVTPKLKDKLFFFFNLEKQFQTSVLTDQFTAASLQPLNAIFASPERYTYLTTRFDYHLSSKHTLFARYSHDGNFTFGQYRGTHPEPSFWNYNNNWSDQSMIGITSTLTPALVNDFRFQYHYWQNNVTPTLQKDCQFPCVGFGLPSIEGMQGAADFGAGVTDNSPQFRQARSYEFIESLSWQKGTHRLRFGMDFEDMHTKVVPWDACELGCLGLYTPETTRQLAGAGLVAQYLPNLPSTITSTADLLNLPVFNTSTSIYSGFPVGNGTFPGFYEHNQGGTNKRIQPYMADTWKARKNLTLNFGLGYDLETGLFYSNIPRPQFLTPILTGQTGGAPYGLSPTAQNTLDFSPSFGFAWSPFNDNKTVIRGGAGLYWDTQVIWEHFREGGAIGPVGDGRTTLPANVFTNIFPNIVNLTTGAPIPVGNGIPLNTLTNLTLGEWIQIYNQQKPGLVQRFGTIAQTSGPIAVTGIDVAKTGIEIYPSHFPLNRSFQTSIGVQRDLGHNMVITADYARRVFTHVNLGEEDLNRSTRVINGKVTPVIPSCGATPNYTPGVECSNGPITIWDPEGRTVYDGLLVKLTKRFSHNYQFIASYALQKDLNAAAVNLDNIFAGFGPATGVPKHNLNVAGVVHLPWGFELSINSAIQSRLPFAPIIAGVDLNGAGNTNFPITEAVPASYGQQYQCFSYSCGKDALVKDIAYWNANLAGTKDFRGITLPKLTLPSHYQMGDPLLSQDFRLTYAYALKEKYKFSIFGEAYNAFNIANLTGYNTVLNTPTFGQPTARFAQVFNSGGPRAFQVGARFQF
jgi:hypothetical protein